MSDKKNILLLSYYWPPAGGSGVQRWMYFAKYLKEFGHQVTVITVDEKQASYSSTDESLKSHVSDIEVHKTKTFELIRLYSFLKTGNSKKAIPQGNVGTKKRKSSLDKLSSFIRANYFIPDARVGWNPYAFKKASELLTQNKFDVLITTGPPHSTHLAGLKLKEKFGIKWIADFRDPWSEVYYNEIFKRTKRNRLKDQLMEKNVLERADLVLTIGDSMKDLLAKKVNPAKIKFVYNGFDEDLLKGVEKREHSSFVLSYTGTLSSNYPYQSLLDALREIKIPNLELWFTGKIEPEIIREFEELESVKVIFNGLRNHQESYNNMSNSDVNLLLLPYQADSKIMITGKVFEYLSTSKPILCIGSKEADAVKIIEQESSISGCFEKEDVNQIISFIQNKEKSRQVNTDGLNEKFSRKSLSQELEKLIKSL